jgi:uncharacterized FlgJ-related protein
LKSSANKKFISRNSGQQKKRISKFMDDLLGSIERHTSEPETDDEWIKKTAGSYSSRKKDLQSLILKGISR